MPDAALKTFTFLVLAAFLEGRRVVSKLYVWQ